MELFGLSISYLEGIGGDPTTSHFPVFVYCRHFGSVRRKFSDMLSKVALQPRAAHRLLMMCHPALCSTIPPEFLSSRNSFLDIIEEHERQENEEGAPEDGRPHAERVRGLLAASDLAPSRGGSR